MRQLEERRSPPAHDRRAPKQQIAAGNYDGPDLTVLLAANQAVIIRLRRYLLAFLPLRPWGIFAVRVRP